MALNSGIEWTEATWNPIAGCTPVSPGCLNCYAARMALRLERMDDSRDNKYRGTAKKSRNGRPVFTGRINLDPDSLGLPQSWRKPRRIFVNSMSDLFHKDVPLEFIQRVFAVMESCPQHVFQVLTKRPEVALQHSSQLEWPANVWMGTSVENALYVHRIHTLREIPAKVRFLSCEPLIGAIPHLPLSDIHWVIVGGESGFGARAMLEQWVVDIRNQCRTAEVAFFFKQWGGVQKHVTGRCLAGQTWDEMPCRVAL